MKIINCTTLDEHGVLGGLLQSLHDAGLLLEDIVDRGNETVRFGGSMESSVGCGARVVVLHVELKIEMETKSVTSTIINFRTLFKVYKN